MRNERKLSRRPLLLGVVLAGLVCFSCSSAREPLADILEDAGDLPADIHENSDAKAAEPEMDVVEEDVSDADHPGDTPDGQDTPPFEDPGPCREHYSSWEDSGFCPEGSVCIMPLDQCHPARPRPGWGCLQPSRNRAGISLQDWPACSAYGVQWGVSLGTLITANRLHLVVETEEEKLKISIRSLGTALDPLLAAVGDPVRVTRMRRTEDFGGGSTGLKIHDAGGRLRILAVDSNYNGSWDRDVFMAGALVWPRNFDGRGMEGFDVQPAAPTECVTFGLLANIVDIGVSIGHEDTADAPVFVPSDGRETIVGPDGPVTVVAPRIKAATNFFMHDYYETEAALFIIPDRPQSDEPGQPGAPCERDADCAPSVCAQWPGGAEVCAPLCDEGLCPLGWECETHGEPCRPEQPDDDGEECEPL